MANYPHEFSGGQRIAIAKAIVAKPDVVISRRDCPRTGPAQVVLEKGLIVETGATRNLLLASMGGSAGKYEGRHETSRIQ